MRKSTKLSFILLTFWVWAVAAHAQNVIHVYVVDRLTSQGIPHAVATAKFLPESITADSLGRFTLPRTKSGTLSVTAEGYRRRRVKIDRNTPEELHVVMQAEGKHLGEVVVEGRRVRRYSRKGNPAVELMRRVIAAKKRYSPLSRDYASWEKYQKLTLAINNITQQDIESDFFREEPWMMDHVQPCEMNNKLILPISLTETTSRHLYRRRPATFRQIVTGEKTSGVGQFLETGQNLAVLMKEYFRDVDLLDNQIDLLGQRFPSPIGPTAISFYHFYIEDSLRVEGDSCVRVAFTPVNNQDFGFRGELMVMTDGTYRLRKCDLRLPAGTGVNFVRSLRVEQYFGLQPDSCWAVTTDNMLIELSLSQKLQQAAVLRNTIYSHYDFTPIPSRSFRGRNLVSYDPQARLRDGSFWAANRRFNLGKGEETMDDFMHRLAGTRRFRWTLFALKTLLENYIETGSAKTPSKVDIGPVLSLVSSNPVDGLRMRIGAKTTAHLMPHFFVEGYLARGKKSHKTYYEAKATWSFNRKAYLPHEFPMRTLSVSSAYDVAAASDRYLRYGKDNVFQVIRSNPTELMYFYKRQAADFTWETAYGLRASLGVKFEKTMPAGRLTYTRLADGVELPKMRTTEVSLSLNYQPGQTFITSKEQRFEASRNAPRFTLSHTVGLKGVLGSTHGRQLTELSLYKRFWLGSWGHIDATAKAAAEWQKVPFPLLLMPPVNTSIFEQSEAFSTMRNMEFLNDRMAQLTVAWTLNGKLFNRLPLIRKLKLREYVAVKAMWGHLTDKNNPLLSQNSGDKELFSLPPECGVMRSDPYVEMVVGIHNILHFLEIDYVRRLTYTHEPNISKHGVRLGFSLSF